MAPVSDVIAVVCPSLFVVVVSSTVIIDVGVVIGTRDTGDSFPINVVLVVVVALTRSVVDFLVAVVDANVVVIVDCCCFRYYCCCF